MKGLSPVSPIGFVYFGSLLAKRGSIQLGHRFTLLAKALLEKLESEDIAGEVICVATEVLRFVEPLQTANESLATLGESAAMKEGDIRWACINRLQYFSMMFWACPNLSVVKIICADACQFMKEHDHRASLLFMLPIQKTVLLLIGCTETSMDQEQSRTTQHNKNARHLIVKYVIHLSNTLFDLTFFLISKIAALFMTCTDPLYWIMMAWKKSIVRNSSSQQEIHGFCTLAIQRKH